MPKTDMESSAKAYKELILKLEGVYAANVVLSDNNVPEEIHILADKDKTPKALTRDVQSALSAAFGIAVDYRIISIASVSDKLVEKQKRLNYSGIDIKNIDGSGEVTVYLSCDDDWRGGKAVYKGRNLLSKLRAVALATLDAISQFTGDNGENRLELITAEIIKVGVRPVAMTLICDEDGRQYMGSVFVNDDNENAIVRSVLDALNRYISRDIPT